MYKIKSNGKDISNQEFGSWTVIEIDSEKTILKKKGIYWICRCKCGHIQTLHGGELRCNKSSKCKKCQYRKAFRGYKQIGGSYWCHVRHNAKNNKRQLLITIEEAWQQYIKQNGKCALSGLDIGFQDIGGIRTDQTASLDRIDSSKDYTVDNIQWIHKHINFMKQELKEEYFIYLCNQITNYNRK